MISASVRTSQLFSQNGMSPISKYRCSETNDQRPLIQQAAFCQGRHELCQRPGCPELFQ